MKRHVVLIAGLVLALATWAASAAAHEDLGLPSELEGVAHEAVHEAYGQAPASPWESSLDEHSSNMSLIGNFDDAGTYRLGSDLAFWGKRAILGNYDSPGGFRILDISDPTNPTEVGQLECPGPQNDVSIWRDLVFMSVDSPRQGPQCGAGKATPDATAGPGTAWEGVRVVSIADPAHPTQLAAVYTDCGSHTHTLVPDPANDRVLIYVQSYPLTGQNPHCNAASHRKISVVEVPLADPASAHVVSTPDVSPAIGCHDTTVLMSKRLAASACLTESQIWDISDLEHPRVIAHIDNPAINIHHSTTWSWDGRSIVIGDELAGAEATPGCVGGDQHTPIGALWFYDVTDPRHPVAKSTFRQPRQEVTTICTAHNFNTVPVSDDRDILTSGWYNGGTTVVDFTDPSNPRELGYYIAKGPTENRDDPVRATAWSAYWYNGVVYANNFDEDINSLTEKSRGLDAFRIRDPAIKHTLPLGHLNAQTMEPLPGQPG